MCGRMEKGAEGNGHWFPLESSQPLQEGLLASGDGERRLYVVTVEAPPHMAWIHGRRPRTVEVPHGPAP